MHRYLHLKFGVHFYVDSFSIICSKNPNFCAKENEGSSRTAPKPNEPEARLYSPKTSIIKPRNHTGALLYCTWVS